MFNTISKATLFSTLVTFSNLIYLHQYQKMFHHQQISSLHRLCNEQEIHDWLTWKLSIWQRNLDPEHFPTEYQKKIEYLSDRALSSQFLWQWGKKFKCSFATLSSIPAFTDLKNIGTYSPEIRDRILNKEKDEVPIQWCQQRVKCYTSFQPIWLQISHGKKMNQWHAPIDKQTRITHRLYK